MKIYKLSIYDASEGEVLKWVISKKSVPAASIDFSVEFGGGKVEVEEVKISTDKAGLVNWLNNHYNRDNG